MLRPRIIPCLLVRDKGLVKTVGFGEGKYVGDPINAVRIFNEKEVDELVVLENPWRQPERICKDDGQGGQQKYDHPPDLLHSSPRKQHPSGHHPPELLFPTPWDPPFDRRKRLAGGRRNVPRARDVEK